MSQPFRRHPFRALPEKPVKPHTWDQAEAQTHTFVSQDFGTTQAHVRTAGEGEPLLLVHGLMTSNYSWRYLVGPLSKYYRIYMPDLPAHGRSSAPTHLSYSGEAVARWLGELQRELDIEGCLCVGNSLGGYICMQRALQEPKAFKKLVNIHSPGLPEFRLQLLSKVLKPQGMRQFLAWMARRSPERWVWRNVHYYDESLKSREETKEYGSALASKQGSLAFAQLMATILAPSELEAFEQKLRDRKAQGEKFPCPLLLLYADEDPMVPPNIGYRLGQLVPDAQLKWMTRTSHFAHVDSPNRTLSKILEFLG